MATLVLCLVLCASAAPATPGALPDPMLPTDYRPGVAVGEFLISEKLDGVRGRWNGISLRFRSGELIRAPAWYTAGWPAVPMDGELWIGRGRFDEVSGVARALEPDDAEWRKVRFMVFDLPAHPGPFEARAAAIRARIETAGVPWLQAVAQFRLADADALESTLDRVTADGGEGLILHHARARYRPGPSRLLLKYKRYQQADAVVVGHIEGRGKYRHMLGALVVERADGLRFRLGGGFTDRQRSMPPPIGSRVTYRFNGLTANGVPRFARFVRVRERAPPGPPRATTDSPPPARKASDRSRPRARR